MEQNDPDIERDVLVRLSGNTFVLDMFKCRTARIMLTSL